MKSKDFSVLSYVNREDFIELVKTIPEEYEKFCQVRDAVMLY
jgi:hypothetical protein